MRRGCARGLHLSRLTLLQELRLLQMLVFHLRLRLRLRLRVGVGILLREVSVIALLHLGQLITLLLVSCLQLGLLTLIVSLALICHRFRAGGSRLGFRQLLGMHGDRAPGTARTHDVRVEAAGPGSRRNLGLAVIHRSDELGTGGRALAMLEKPVSEE